MATPAAKGRSNKAPARLLIALIASVLAGDASAQPSQLRHQAWTSLLNAHVREGRVDYAGMKKDRGRLSAYLDRLAAIEGRDFRTWPDHQRMALWINAYNAAAVLLIADHYPVGGIREIVPLWRRPFESVFKRPLVALGHLAPWSQSGSLSLDDIEHRILRPRFHDPRIHFAVVCAAKGCPHLASQAYEGATLEAQLEEATRAFLRDPTKNRYDGEGDRLELSPIFKWFAADFGGRGALAAYWAAYAAPDPRRTAGRSSTRVTFTEYDWSLNE